MRKLPLQLAAPALVVMLGLVAAVVVVVLGRNQIRRETDLEAQHRARVIAATLASRLRFTALEDREPLLREVAREANLEVVLAQSDGSAVVDERTHPSTTKQIHEFLVAGDGVIEDEQGRFRFASHPLGPPLEHLSVIAFIEAPSEPVEARDFASAVLALTALLIGLAVAVTSSYARAANSEILYVGERIRDLASRKAGLRKEQDSLLVSPRTQASDVAIPVRSFDEVGQLTAAFNILVDRFAAAEKSYRADLSEAAQTDKDRLEFLAGLSHELRTPLNAILGFSHVLESEVDGPLTADTRESIEVIRTSGEHLRTLIDDILDLSLLEVDQLKLSRGVVELSKLCSEVVREAGALAKHKGLQLAVASPQPVYANVDKRRVRQIVTNLVSNAVKFTSRGSVTVSLETRGDMAMLSVDDTGLGVPESARVTIFEAYKQVAQTHLRHGGAGLGLATVKRLVELHGGGVWVETNPAGGSRFVATLPLAINAEHEVADASLTSVLPPPVSSS